MEAVQLFDGGWLTNAEQIKDSETAQRLIVRGVLPRESGVCQAEVHLKYTEPELGELVIPISATVRPQEPLP
jgi:hypothetical protein